METKQQYKEWIEKRWQWLNDKEAKEVYEFLVDTLDRRMNKRTEAGGHYRGEAAEIQYEGSLIDK